MVHQGILCTETEAGVGGSHARMLRNKEGDQPEFSKPLHRGMGVKMAIFSVMYFFVIIPI